jgi:hypothetical protein
VPCPKATTDINNITNAQRIRFIRSPLEDTRSTMDR